MLDVDRHGEDVDEWRSRAIALGVTEPSTVVIGGTWFTGLTPKADLEALLATRNER